MASRICRVMSFLAPKAPPPGICTTCTFSVVMPSASAICLWSPKGYLGVHHHLHATVRGRLRQTCLRLQVGVLDERGRVGPLNNYVCGREALVYVALANLGVVMDVPFAGGSGARPAPGLARGVNTPGRGRY